jgi:hypothetical protein
LRERPPRGVDDDEVILVGLQADEEGRLNAPSAGQVVLAVPSPEVLAQDAEEVQRVIRGTGPGTEPLVIVIEDADELRAEELAPVLAGARHARRSVILRITVAGG